jgi:hypothetical protein
MDEKLGLVVDETCGRCWSLNLREDGQLVVQHLRCAYRNLEGEPALTKSLMRLSPSVLYWKPLLGGSCFCSGVTDANSRKLVVF